MPDSTSSPIDLQATLKINEIFYSIQGESTFIGRPCVFIRLTACDLRCTYCDTEYAFFEGHKRTLASILEEVRGHACNLVEVTGGEPLLQPNVHPLLTALADAGYEVLLETSGAHDISRVDARVRRIMDLKCPSSGEVTRNLWPNLDHLHARDEVKFVIGDHADFLWAMSHYHQGDWAQRVHAVLFSPVFGKCTPLALATWILEAKVPVRMQVQLHKIIWDPAARGV
jgi:7-carboxy-7-deazaguanine synthase